MGVGQYWLPRKHLELGVEVEEEGLFLVAAMASEYHRLFGG